MYPSPCDLVNDMGDASEQDHPCDQVTPEARQQQQSINKCATQQFTLVLKWISKSALEVIETETGFLKLAPGRLGANFFKLATKITAQWADGRVAYHARTFHAQQRITTLADVLWCNIRVVMAGVGVGHTGGLRCLNRLRFVMIGSRWRPC